MARVADPKRWEKGKHFPAWLGLALLLLLGFLVSFGNAMWLAFAESGSGETRTSPDGRYEASAFNKSQGTIWGDRAEWDEIRVTEKSTRRETWLVKRYPAPGAAPDYGMRGVKFVEWAADSSAVTVDIGGGQKMTLPVP